ncbi:MAG TPA: MerR family transcriptional regulator [Xanthobacteraceae bacterium]|nr:MerR family transcriptional regulator [Xanthobacteraceae bacterium]
MDKAPDAFRTISEVADEIDVPQHVLRFWESRFTQIKPMKRGGGRRYYRPDDVDLLRGVRHLLYGEGYTIRGVQRILRDEGAAFVQNVWREGAVPAPPPESDDVGDEPAMETSEARPDLSLFSLAPSRAGEDERREPTIVPPAAMKPQATLAPSVGDKLRNALNELVACRRLIDAALSDNDPADRNGRSAEI